MSEPTLVLNMIVKDEAPIITRFLGFVLPLIDAWAIMDTGSTDGTPDIIAAELAGIPGRLGHMEWQGFAAARNAAIELAGGLGDYLLFLDADDQAVLTEDHRSIKRQLTADLHHGMLQSGDTAYPRLLFARNGCKARYRGVIHEVLIGGRGEQVGPTISGFSVLRGTVGVGNRSTRGDEKYRDDAALLEQAIARNDDPDFLERYQFYLAQSYRDCGEKERALDAYRIRLDMPGGYQQERYVAAMNIGRLLEELNEPFSEILLAYLRAHEIDPSRPEAPHRIAACARRQEMWNLAFENAVKARDAAPPRDKLFIDTSVAEWKAHFEVSVAAWHVGRMEDGMEACRHVLRSTRAPEDVRNLTAVHLQRYARSGAA